jgi:hypothetical protein
LSDVDWSLDGSSELQLVGLDRDNLQKRHLNHELLWSLVIKAILLTVPSGSLKI